MGVKGTAYVDNQLYIVEFKHLKDSDEAADTIHYWIDEYYENYLEEYTFLGYIKKVSGVDPNCFEVHKIEFMADR